VARIVVALSGGVDSAVAAALLADAGHDLVGVTLRLWPQSRCCDERETKGEKNKEEKEKKTEKTIKQQKQKK
jgi:tRNA U34 2-thiouridine synthase MnmA/TrmU